MSISRRQFIKAGAAGLLTGSFAGSGLGQESTRPKTLIPVHLVYEYGTNDVLSSQNENEPCNPASLTKLVEAAALYRFKKQDLLTSAAKEIAQAEYEIRRSLIISDNRAAERVAAFLTRQESVLREARKRGLVPGTEWTYGRLVAAPLAAELGMENTHIWTASGLPGDDKNVPFNVTTAADLKKLCNYIYDNHDEIIKICAQPYVDMDKKWGINTNPLLESSPRENARPYPGVDSLKTGFIDEAGYNLIASAVRNDRRIIVISIGNKTPQQRIDNVTALLDDGFAKLEKKYKPKQPEHDPYSAPEVMLA